MKKLYVISLFGFSSLILAQSWDLNENIFNNPHRRPYENVSKKSEREIDQEMRDVRTIVNRSAVIYGHFKEENVAEGQSGASSGPGAPGEPVPINGHLPVLWIFAILLCLFATQKKMKQVNS